MHWNHTTKGIKRLEPSSTKEETGTTDKGETRTGRVRSSGMAESEERKETAVCLHGATQILGTGASLKAVSNKVAAHHRK